MLAAITEEPFSGVLAGLLRTLVPICPRGKAHGHPVPVNTAVPDRRGIGRHPSADDRCAPNLPSLYLHSPLILERRRPSVNGSCF
jgi:hypothetical protein